MTTSIDQAIAKIEAALKTLESDVVGFVKDTVEPAVKAELTVLGPQILGLGETTLSFMWTAAEAYLASLATGGTVTFAAAVASVMTQLPAELQALEHVVAAGLAGAVQSISSQTPAAPVA